jgi:hypothetical protein
MTTGVLFTPDETSVVRGDFGGILSGVRTDSRVFTGVFMGFEVAAGVFWFRPDDPGSSGFVVSVCRPFSSEAGLEGITCGVSVSFGMVSLSKLEFGDFAMKKRESPTLPASIRLGMSDVSGGVGTIGGVSFLDPALTEKDLSACRLADVAKDSAVSLSLL